MRRPKKTHVANAGEKKGLQDPRLGSSRSVVTEVREKNVVWFCSQGAVLPSSPGQGLVTAELFAPEMFWRANLGWGGIYEWSSGDGLALGGAVGPKSIVPFLQVGLLQGLPSQLAITPCLPDKSLHIPSTVPGSSPASLSQPAWRGDATWVRADVSTHSAPCHPHHKLWYGSRSPMCSPTGL